MPYNRFLSFELVPPIDGGISLLENIISKLNKYINIFNIVDTPLGIPRPSSPLIASYLKTRYENTEFIPHIKIVNSNKVGLLSLLLALKSINIKRVLIISGDKPIYKTFMNTLKPETFIKELKKNDMFKNLEIGIGLGKNVTYSYLKDKLLSQPDFIITQPFTNIHEIIKFKDLYSKICKKYNVNTKIYATYIVPSNKNKIVFKSLNIDYEKFSRNSEALLDLLLVEFDGILFSSPLDVDKALLIISETVHRLGEKAICR